jgi:VWFA-related protein
MTPKKLFTFILLLILFSSAGAALCGQQQATEPDPEASDQGGFKIGVEVNMVTVPITVRKKEGGFLKGLPKSAFRIYEDGEPQEIVFFAQEGLPTRIAIVLDSSGSVRSEWGTIKYATKKFIENLHPEDAFSLVSFNTDIRLKMDWGQKTDRVDAVLTSIYCKDNTNLWDALWVVCTDVFRGIEEKKAIIIMSDGLDTGSSVTYKEALQSAVRSEAALYIVSKTEAVRQLMMYQSSKTPGYYNRISHEDFVNADLALRKLAHETGGRVLYPNSFGQLDDIYSDVYEELRSQYTVGYVSTNTAMDGSYRSIGVRVNARDAIISARPGYFANQE